MCTELSSRALAPSHLSVRALALVPHGGERPSSPGLDVAAPLASVVLDEPGDGFVWARSARYKLRFGRDVVVGSGIFDCDPTVPGVACNFAELRTFATALADDVTLEITIDGKPLKGLLDQRVQSPEFTITYPADSITGVPVGSYTPNLTDGYWLMLRPLSPGAHTIRFKGEFLSGLFAGTVSDITYNLIVEGREGDDDGDSDEDSASDEDSESDDSSK